MPGAPPPGDPAPPDGALPPEALAGLGRQPFGVYVHVPFCRTRCGYCDFTTYTPAELGALGGRPAAVYAAAYADLVAAELRLARRVLGPADLPVATVFLGGGTPTLLPTGDIAGILTAVRAEFGLRPDAEVTVEANPDTVQPRSLEALRAAGVTRLSLGMQSASPHVLAVLERTHTPGRAVAAARQARAAGFEHVNLDLIYGTPGESAADWARSLAAVVETDVDHVSAYALIVEDGTRLADRIRRGELPEPDDDVAADRYEQADDALAGAGLEWYEVSNWARPGGACQHNLGYWRGADWWGVGPGAHSHVGGVRWWNVRHPGAYADRITADRSPAQAREVLTPEQRHLEEVLLGVRLREGLVATRLGVRGRAAADRLAAAGLLNSDALDGGRVVLTRQGRLLADAVVRDLTA